MNVAWGTDAAVSGASVALSGSYDPHEAGVALEVQVWNSADVDGSAPRSDATPVATVEVVEAADLASFTATWVATAPASGSDGFLFFARLSDGSQSAISDKLSVAPPPEDPAPEDESPAAAAPAGEDESPAAAAPAGEDESPAAAAPAGDPPADDSQASGGAPTNLQWQQADGTAITSASPGDNVTLSFDLAHDDGNQVTVDVLGSDGTTPVGTAQPMERSDATGFTAAWIVAAGDDRYSFRVTVSNPTASSAPAPAISSELTVETVPPAHDYYYPPDEKPALSYVVKVTPEPPADAGQCRYHRGSESGDVIGTDDLVTQGTGTLEVDLSSFHAATDSPVFLEFVFSKDGHEDQTASRAVALADPAPATIAVPGDARPGDSVPLEVTAWNAVVYDTAGSGAPTPESDASRVSSDARASVKWRVGGQDVADTGEKISYTIPDDATGSLEVEAYVDAASSFPARAAIQVAGADTGSWTAAWSSTTAQDEATVPMVLTAPGLAAGTTVTFEVTMDGFGKMGETTATSEDGSATADWDQWFHPDLAAPAVDGDHFATATFSFKASTPERAAETTEALTYADRLWVTLQDDTGTPLANVAVTVHSPWGDLDATTDGDGVLDVTIPPGGAHVSTENGVAMGTDT